MARTPPIRYSALISVSNQTIANADVNKGDQKKSDRCEHKYDIEHACLLKPGDHPQGDRVLTRSVRNRRSHSSRRNGVPEVHGPLSVIVSVLEPKCDVVVRVYVYRVGPR